MPEYNNPEIIRTEDFVVTKTDKNQYGDLFVTSAEGKTYKISNKREHLFPVFQEGVSVHICWASFMNREYIADAVQSDQVVAAPQKQVKPSETQTASVKTPAETKSDGKNRAFALSYSKDWAIALLQSGKKDLSGGSIIQLASVFEEYLNTGKVPDSVLVKEAKKLGATEKGKEDNS